MRVIIIIIAAINSAKAGFHSSCQIEGIDETDWYYGKQLHIKLPDSQESPFVQFHTRNVIGIKEQASVYLNASYGNNLLVLFPSSKFKLFEQEYKDRGSALVDISINLECLNNTAEVITLKMHVEDVNSNAPIFNKATYKYHFGMTIPEDYSLTDILPISVTDADFSNNRITFTMEYNTRLRLQHKGQMLYYDDNYYTKLKSLTELKPPFHEEFRLVATDGGIPPRKSTARLIVSVSSNAIHKAKLTHKPTFSKQCFIAEYHSKYLEMLEPIKLNYGTEDTLLKHRGFEDYFKISLKSGIVQVRILQPLPKSVIKSKKFILIEIEALNRRRNESDRTVVIIRLQNRRIVSKSLLFSIPQNCFSPWGLYESNSWLLLVYIFIILIVMIINTRLLFRYFHQRKISRWLPL